MLRRLELGATQLQLLSNYYLHTATNPQMHGRFDKMKSRELPKGFDGLSLLSASCIFPSVFNVDFEQEIDIAMFRNKQYK